MINLLKNTTLTICLLAAIPTAAVTASPATSAPAVASQGPIEFAFQGGSALSLFAQLSEAFPDFSVVIGAKARDFVIPEFTARITKPGTIVDLVCNVQGHRAKLQLDRPGMPDGGWEEVDRIKGTLEYRPVNNELVYISFAAWSDFGRQSSTFVEVISIQELLTSGMAVEEIFGTVEAGIDLKDAGQDDSRTEVRFHEATGVLFVKGTKSVNGMVSETIEALKTSAQWRVSDAAIAAKEARIRSEALDSLGQATKEAARIQQDKLKQLMKDHDALMERQRQKEDAKDAAMEREEDAKDADLERAFEKEEAKEDE
jgi:hypothetical protein